MGTPPGGDTRNTALDPRWSFLPSIRRSPGEATRKYGAYEVIAQLSQTKRRKRATGRLFCSRRGTEYGSTGHKSWRGGWSNDGWGHRATSSIVTLFNSVPLLLLVATKTGRKATSRVPIRSTQIGSGHSLRLCYGCTVQEYMVNILVAAGTTYSQIAGGECNFD